MLSASLAETAACLIRVPTEVVKSRMQTGKYKELGLVGSVARIVRTEGLRRGMWKGYGTTVAREVSSDNVGDQGA
jgi:solute carrier family 25 (mitochondrial S-adenosylmethionine transporter), member 26